MLTDEEIDALADDVAFCDGKAEAITIIREAVRMTALRCAEEVENLYPARAGTFNGMTVQKCAAAIRERIKDKPRPPFDPNQGFGPI